MHASVQLCIAMLSMYIGSLIKRGTERNGTEWKKLIKHGTELLSRHKAHLRTHGPRSYTHANCSCTRARRERLADRFAHSFSWKRMGSRLHAPYQRILELSVHYATAQYDDDDDN